MFQARKGWASLNTVLPRLKQGDLLRGIRQMPLLPTGCELESGYCWTVGEYASRKLLLPLASKLRARVQDASHRVNSAGQRMGLDSDVSQKFHQQPVLLVRPLALYPVPRARQDVAAAQAGQGAGVALDLGLGGREAQHAVAFAGDEE